MALTTLTLDDIRYEVEDFLGLEHGDNDLDDGTILIAADKYLKFYRSLETIKAKEKGRKKSVSTSIPSTGYDLTTIPNIYDYTRGFKLYKTSVAPENRLFPVQEGGQRVGYYITGDDLFINGIATPLSCIIEYQEASQRINQSDDPTVIVPEIDEMFEDMLVRYIAYRYYTNKGDNPAAAEDALNDSRSMTLETFDLMRKNVATA